MDRRKIYPVIEYMLKTHRFYANLLLSTHFNETKKISTAGVNVKAGKIQMYINPYFWQALNDKFGVEGQAAVLIHEMLHVVSAHLERFKDTDIRLHKAVNVSADCAINQFIKDLPKNFEVYDEKGERVLRKDENGNEQPNEPITLDNFRKICENNKILEKMETEYYYEMLKKAQKEKGIDFDNLPEFDDHALWEESEGSTEEIKEVIRRDVKKAVEDLKGGHNAGRIPAEIEHLVTELLKSEVNWKVVLRSFISNSMDVLYESCRKKRNRRYGILYPGYKTETKLNLVLGIDTSGSIDDDTKRAFFTEINAIMSDEIDLTIVECDAGIHSVYKYNKKMSEITFKGGGGTAYIPFLEKAEELKADGLIVFGDGYCFDKLPEKWNKCQVLWAITEGGQVPATFGKALTIKVPRS